MSGTQPTGSFVAIPNPVHGASVPPVTVWVPNSGGNVAVPHPQYGFGGGGSFPATTAYFAPKK